MNDLTSILHPLPLYAFRATLRLAHPLPIDTQRRSILWRGAFGTVLRSLVCHDQRQVCETCTLRAPCPFVRIFSPSIPSARPVIGRLATPPRPFVLTDPIPESTSLPAAQPLGLGLILVGTTIDLLPYFVVTLRKLGEVGLGRARTRFVVDAIESLDASASPVSTVFRAGADTVETTYIELRASDLERPRDRAARKIRITFRTPTNLRGSGYDEASSAPPFHILIRRARDRVSALATFFGDDGLSFDARELATRAESVTLVRAELQHAAVARRSTRTGDRHWIAGALGTADYEGDLAQFMPWLRVAERVGVGRHATFGNGRITVDVLA